MQTDSKEPTQETALDVFLNIISINLGLKGKNLNKVGSKVSATWRYLPVHVLEIVCGLATMYREGVRLEPRVSLERSSGGSRGYDLLY